MSDGMPAIALTAVPGRRRATLDAAREIERRGFAGIYCPSPFGGLNLCEALALVTERIPFGITVAPIYARHPEDFAQTAAFVHEVSGGRFTLGVGVSHGPVLERMGIHAGKPLGDMRRFVESYQAVPNTGDKAPLILAAMRQKMIALAGEIANGFVFANAARSHVARSLSALPTEKRDDSAFFIGDMAPTCVNDDIEAAKAVHRRTLSFYVRLPNYRNYWKEAGYEQEMADVEKAMVAKDNEALARALSDRWLDDVTLFGPPARIREGVEAWRAAGVRTPILVPSSANGNQMVALQEVFAAFA